jgi:hypothetical protein
MPRHYLVPIISLRNPKPIDSVDVSTELYSRRYSGEESSEDDESFKKRSTKPFQVKLKSNKNEFLDNQFFKNYFLHQMRNFRMSTSSDRRQDAGKVTDRLSIYKIDHGVNVDSKKGRYLYFSDGDGFVNIESLLGCLHWFDHPKRKFYFDIRRDSHLGLLRNVESVDYLVDIIMKIR